MDCSENRLHRVEEELRLVSTQLRHLQSRVDQIAPGTGELCRPERKSYYDQRLYWAVIISAPLAPSKPILQPRSPINPIGTRSYLHTGQIDAGVFTASGSQDASDQDSTSEEDPIDAAAIMAPLRGMLTETDAVDVETPVTGSGTQEDLGSAAFPRLKRPYSPRMDNKASKRRLADSNSELLGSEGVQDKSTEPLDLRDPVDQGWCDLDTGKALFHM